MTEPHPLKLLQLRILVGFLGERAQCGWWPTAFFESSSKLFLEPVFSKTPCLAQFHGVLEAARCLHDEHLSVGSYHLFRLPEEVEEDLHAIVQSSVGEEFVSLATQNKVAALDKLDRLVQFRGNPSIGPTAVGKIGDIASEATLKAIAAAYQSAFKHKVRTYPYLVG